MQSSSFSPARLLQGLALAALPLTALLPGAAEANERRFAYTYETGVLPPDAKEIEVWTTSRFGRDDYYHRLENRLEFEVGVAPFVQTAFYLNWRSTSSVAADGSLNDPVHQLKGVSNEWKVKLMDPAADAVGLGLYGEIGIQSYEYELEGKLLLDKQVGPLTLATNFVGELEYITDDETGSAETELEEITLEWIVGASYQIRPSFGVGLELRNVNGMEKEGDEMEFAYSTVYLGPSLNYSTKSWWLTFAVMPQLPAFKAGDEDATFELGEQEYLNTRLLFSFHI